MAYTPRTITDRVVEFPRRYKMTLVSADTYDLTPVTGSVVEGGTAINKIYLQPLENELAKAIQTGDKIDGGTF